MNAAYQFNLFHNLIEYFLQGVYINDIVIEIRYRWFFQNNRDKSEGANNSR